MTALDNITASRRFPVALFFGLVLTAAFAAVGAKLWMESGLVWRCPAIVLLGMPCPSCGSTRAFASLAAFDFIRAIAFNPLMVVGIASLPFFPFLQRFGQKFRAYGWILFGAAVFLNWLYLVFFLPR